MGTEVQSYISLLLPYYPKFPASRLLGLPPALTLVHFSAYSTLKMEAICSSECRLTFNGLHGVISQQIVLFITTAVRTSDSIQHDVSYSVRVEKELSGTRAASERGTRRRKFTNGTVK
jgi:hypothetical protein